MTSTSMDNHKTNRQQLLAAEQGGFHLNFAHHLALTMVLNGECI